MSAPGSELATGPESPSNSIQIIVPLRYDLGQISEASVVEALLCCLSPVVRFCLHAQGPDRWELRRYTALYVGLFHFLKSKGISLAQWRWMLISSTIQPYGWIAEPTYVKLCLRCFQVQTQVIFKFFVDKPNDSLVVSIAPCTFLTAWGRHAFVD